MLRLRGQILSESRKYFRFNLLGRLESYGYVVDDVNCVRMNVTNYFLPKIGDILLKVSGVPLSGLSLRQALDILRSSPAVTVLQVCRVSDNSGNSWSVQPAPRSRSSIVRSYSYGPVSVPAMEGIQTPRRLLIDMSTSGDTSYTPSSLSLCSGESMDIEISPPSPTSSSGELLNIFKKGMLI